MTPPPALAIASPAPAAPSRDRGGGGVSDGSLPPPAILATMLVIAGDVMLFAGLLFAYWALRLAAPVWPPPLQPRLPVGVTAPEHHDPSPP